MTRPSQSPVSRYLDHVFNKDHVWDHEKYLQSANWNGTSFGLETGLRVQYCHGNSFCAGYIGDYRIRIYGSSLQGYQVYVWPSCCEFDTYFDGKKTPKHFSPDQKDALTEYLKDETALPSLD